MRGHLLADDLLFFETSLSGKRSEKRKMKNGAKRRKRVMNWCEATIFITHNSQLPLLAPLCSAERCLGEVGGRGSRLRTVN
jgi:hypothetical protein